MHQQASVPATDGHLGEDRGAEEKPALPPDVHASNYVIPEIKPVVPRQFDKAQKE